MLHVKKVLLGTAVFLLSLGLFSNYAFASGNTTGTVTASLLHVRSGPAKTYKVTSNLSKGKKVTILSKNSLWYKIKTSTGKTGWVKKEYVAVSKTSTAAVSKKTASVKAAPVKAVLKITSAAKVAAVRTVALSRGEGTLTDDIRSEDLSVEMISYAKEFLGVPYVWGGSTPQGFDCSGFVQYVYKHFGISIKRVAADQATQGTWVDIGDLRAGDLVFFDTNGGHNYINHVGMYIGDGNFIQASSGHASVVITDLTKGFYAGAYMTAKRFIP